MGKVDGKDVVLAAGTTDENWEVVHGGRLTGEVHDMTLHLRVDNDSWVELTGSASKIFVDYINGASTIDLGALEAGSIESGKVEGQSTVILHAAGDIRLKDGINGQSHVRLRITGDGNLTVGGWIDGQSSLDADLSTAPTPAGNVTFEQKIDGQSQVALRMSSGTVKGDRVAGHSQVNVRWSGESHGTHFNHVDSGATVQNELALS